MIERTKKLLEDYHKLLQDVQRERNALRAENEKLEAKLAEKKKEKIEYTDTINFVVTSEPDIVANELDRLNQQLTEKDKQIKKLNLEAQKYYEDAYCNDANYQDKISFAVEQLEQTRKLVDDLLYNYGHKRYEVWEIFDNQIKKLKEVK